MSTAKRGQWWPIKAISQCLSGVRHFEYEVYPVDKSNKEDEDGDES